VRILIGATGFIGRSLREREHFDVVVHRSDIETIRGLRATEIVCAGLPAEKWLANAEPEDDWRNVCRLASTLGHVEAERFVLISTVDVYATPHGVSEETLPDVDAAQAYGRNRAWFEWFCRGRFPNVHVLRLPGMFGTHLKKNLVFDLLNEREDQWSRVSAASTFQFFDADTLHALVRQSIEADIRVLNVATEPVRADAVAAIFGVRLSELDNTVSYDMRTVHDATLGGAGGYLLGSRSVLDGIARLRDRWHAT
jgi:nucleoside-diphosphate-sugar epimerase